LLQACCTWNDFQNICLLKLKSCFPYFLDKWGWPPTQDRRSLASARDDWWTLDFANAFVSPGVNSRGELVPSHGASRRRLGDKYTTLIITDR
jgi:hypothetical protein